MKKLTIGAAALAAVLSGAAIAQTTHPLVATLAGTDLFQLQQSTGPGNQWTTLTAIGAFARAISGPLVGTTLNLSGVFNVANGQGAFYGNISGAYPISTTTGYALSDNFTLGAREVDFWNADTAATTSFNFYQKTGASAATLVASMGPTGILTVGGGVVLPTAATISATTGLILTPLRPVEMKLATGLQMAATASGTGFGLTYTPGTTEVLVGTATSSNTTGNTAAIDVVLPPWYIAGTNITVKVGCYYTESSGSTTTHTMAAAAYLNTVAGAQGSTLIATAAQVCPITTSALQTFTITGTTLLPGSHLTLTFTAAVANGTGASTEWLTSASIN